MILVGSIVVVALIYGFVFVASYGWTFLLSPLLQRRDRILAAFTLFFGFIVGSQLFLGIIGKLDRFWFLLLILTYSLGSLFVSRTFVLWRIPPLSLGIRAVIVVWLLIQCYCMLFIVLFPPFTNDGLGYHLPNVAKWYQTGRIHQIATPNWASNTLPMNQELVALSSVVLLHNDLVVEWGQFLFVPMLVITLFCLGRFVGGTSYWSLIASLGYSVVPALFLQSITNMSDYALVTLALTSLYWAIMWHTKSQLPFAVLCGISLGLLVGTKTQGLHFTVALGLLLAGLIISKRRWIQSLSFIGFCFVGVFVFGSFWYIKNWHFFGNPFFPFEVKLLWLTFHNPPGSYPLRGYGFEFQNIAINGSALWSQLWQLWPHYHPDLARINGWGWWWLIPGLPLMIGAFIKNYRYRILALPIVLYFVLIIGSIFYQPGNARFLLIVPALPFLALAALSSTVSRRTDIAPLILFSVLAQMMTTWITCWNFGILDTFRIKHILSTPALLRSAYLMMPEWYTKVGEVQRLPLQESVGYFGEQNELSYVLYEPTLTRKVAYIEPTTVDGVITQLNALHIQYLVAEPTPLFSSLVYQLEQSGCFSQSVRGSYLLRYEPHCVQQSH